MAAATEKEEEANASNGHIANLKQSILTFDILYGTDKGAFRKHSYYRDCSIFIDRA